MRCRKDVRNDLRQSPTVPARLRGGGSKSPAPSLSSVEAKRLAARQELFDFLAKHERLPNRSSSNVGKSSAAQMADKKHEDKLARRLASLKNANPDAYAFVI